jgi:GcrA cell cycle regulator
MTASDVIMSVWDDPRNVETLKRLYDEGLSHSQIANAMGQGLTRNAVIGKVTRLKLAKREPRSVAVRSDAASTGKRGRAWLPGQASAQSIVHRRIGRQKAEDRRINAKIQHSGAAPFRAGSLPPEEGVDATHLIGFRDRGIGKECSFIPGDPHDGAKCCGKPVKEGTEWCPEHYARVFTKARND